MDRSKPSYELMGRGPWLWLKRLEYGLARTGYLRLVRGELRQPGLSVLDVGSADGEFLRYLRRRYPHNDYVGLESDERLRSKAIEKAAGATFVAGRAEELPFPAHSLDIIFALHVIEHLPQPVRLLDEIARVLKPQGVALIATPNLGSVSAKIMGAKWAGYSDPTHVSLRDVDGWRRAIINSGLKCEVIRTSGINGLFPFTLPGLRHIASIPLLIFGYLRWTLGDAVVIKVRHDRP